MYIHVLLLVGMKCLVCEPSIFAAQGTHTRSPLEHLFVGDFVSVYWAQKEVITARIIRFYTKVRRFNIHSWFHIIAFVNDLILYITFIFIYIFIVQEFRQTVFVEVEILTDEQFYRSSHQITSTMYYDVDCLVASDLLEVYTADIISGTQLPSGILTWEHATGTLQRVSIEV